jgi:hypothetical protein
MSVTQRANRDESLGESTANTGQIRCAPPSAGAISEPRGPHGPTGPKVESGPSARVTRGLGPSAVFAPRIRALGRVRREFPVRDPASKSSSGPARARAGPPGSLITVVGIVVCTPGCTHSTVTSARLHPLRPRPPFGPLVWHPGG